MPDGQKHVVIEVRPNEGYSPFQVERKMTLADLKNLVDRAIEEHGPDAEVVTRDTGNLRGASWGRISPDSDIELYQDEELD